jgi:hypothetical protein
MGEALESYYLGKKQGFADGVQVGLLCAAGVLVLSLVLGNLLSDKPIADERATRIHKIQHNSKVQFDGEKLIWKDCVLVKNEVVEETL